MTISEVRADLLDARQAAREGDLPETLRRLQRALDHITPERLLTSAEAATLLDIRSPTVVLGWCRTGFLHGVRRGDQTMIPLAEIERIQDSDQVRAIRALDRLHDQSAAHGSDEGMSDDEMEALHQARPGTLPWERPPEMSATEPPE